MLSITIVIAAGLASASPAQAAADYYIEDDATGGDCFQIGNWDDVTKTCTLKWDVPIHGTNNGIEILDDNITLDGAGHRLFLHATRVDQHGVLVLGHIEVTIKNLKVEGFSGGIELLLCQVSDVVNNRLVANAEGLGLYTSNQTLVNGNMFIENSNNGVNLVNSDFCGFLYNNFVDNTPAQVQLDAGSNGFNFWRNYWSDWDSVIGAENCVNVAPFDFFCDTDYLPGSVNDTEPAVIQKAFGRYDWTWYDDIYGDNWVLLGNMSETEGGMLFDLSIEGAEQPLAEVPGGEPGYLPLATVIANKYSGLMGGPVTARWYSMGPDKPVTSQRILWPKGGSSLEEVPGVSPEMMDSRLFWSWYDMQSPGYKNWIMISNPNAYPVYYSISIGNQPVMSGYSIPANGYVARQFPGFIGGPVEVNAYNSESHPVFIMASQRVLSNGDKAFNEVPGQPASDLADEYVWTWYDQRSPGAYNWVMVAKPRGTPGSLYYEIWIAGLKVTDGGPIAGGSSVSEVFPGIMDGPVKVKCFADGGHAIAADCIASQRSIWGPSFEEVPGVEADSLESRYAWTWYDMFSPGASNWVIVANPSDTETIRATVFFYDEVSNVIFQRSENLAPGADWTPVFPGRMGGPVLVRAVQQGTSNPMPVLTSQRVLWNGYFNEVWGQ